MSLIQHFNYLVVEMVDGYVLKNECYRPPEWKVIKWFGLKYKRSHVQFIHFELLYNQKLSESQPESSSSTSTCPSLVVDRKSEDLEEHAPRLSLTDPKPPFTLRLSATCAAPTQIAV